MSAGAAPVSAGAAPVSAGAAPLPRLVGPASLGAAIGVVTVFAGLVLLKAPVAEPGSLTINGMHNMRPERDTVVYLTAGLVSVLATVLLARVPTLPSRRISRLGRWPGLVVAAGTVAMATTAFLRVRRALPLSAQGGAAYLALSVWLVALCALAALVTGRSDGKHQPAPPGSAAPPFPVRPGLIDLAVLALVALVVYLPAWQLLAGNAFAGEGSLHLDFFALGPALVFQAGGALGTELHSYYGVGWPLVFSLLEPLSYGHIIRLEAIYGCIYFGGVYVLLRVLVGDRRWAVVGTALAILFQLFAGWPAGLLLWRFPSATVMRWPFDVWFFLACALHLRTRHPAWAVTAGALVGTAVVFQTDTGLALGISFVLFWACLWSMEGRRIWPKLAWSAVAAALVLIAGLGVASRWTMLSGAFVEGWLENLRLAAAGATFLALTTEPTSLSIVLFVGITTCYLAVLGWVAAARGTRRLQPSSVMLGCIALYGFVTLLYFVGRSSPVNLFRPAVPFAILLAACAGFGHRAWIDRRLVRGSSASVPAAVAWAALCTTIVVFAAHPGVRAYPSLLRSAWSADEPRGVCLFEDPDDVCGLGPEAGRTVDELRGLASRLRDLDSPRSTVAVLDEIGSVILLMSDGRPWGRYQPVFAGMFTWEMADSVERDLRDEPPALVVMRAEEVVAPFFSDVWRRLRPSVERGYELDSRHGEFEIWQRR